MKEVTALIERQKYKTLISNDTNMLIADEPVPHGDDLGFDPYSLLLASLGGCVAMTVRMYADRKKWNLESVEVKLTQERVHAKDCVDCISKEGSVHVIEKKVKFTGDLSNEQRDRLMEIVERCPVNKTLSNEIKIKTKRL